jgi:L-fucose isomerase-like protein
MIDSNAFLRPRVGVASLSSPLEVGADRAPRAAEDLARWLGEAGCEVLPLGSINGPDLAAAAGRKIAENHLHAVAFATASWFEDYLVLDLLEEFPLPVLLWSLPGMETGALCGTQQLTAYLKQIGSPFSCVYGPLEKGPNLTKAVSFLHAASLKFKLRRARIGLAGHRVIGMTEVAANEMGLKISIGPRVVNIDLPGLLNRAAEISDDSARPLWQKLLQAGGGCKVSETAGLDSMKVYLAIKEQTDRLGLSALTVGCYPHLMGRVCLAASLLADQGIPLGCEGDVNGVVGQLILTLLTGGPTHNTDWLEPLSDGTVVLTHCGSGSFSLAEKPADITIASVRLMGQGACALFPARPGPVTLVSLIPVGNTYQFAVLEGEALHTDMVFPGNPLRVKFNVPTDQIIDWIHEEGIGHHWMAGYGHVAATLRQWSTIAGPNLRLVEP